MKQTIHIRWQTVLRKAGLVVPFIALAVLSAVLFPRYTTSFRYHCEVGKPWAYDLVTAEFDFPIYKTSAQLAAEEQQLLETFAPCFTPVDSKLWAADNAVVPVIRYEDQAWMAQEGYRKLAVISNHVSTTYSLDDVLTEKSAYERFGVATPANIVLDTAMTNRLKTKLLASIAPTQGVVQTGEKIIDRGEIVTERDYQIL